RRRGGGGVLPFPQRGAEKRRAGGGGGRRDRQGGGRPRPGLTAGPALVRGAYAATLAGPQGPVGRGGAGVADGLQRLWSPHRMAYIKGENRAATDGPEECPFCRIPELDDAEGLIVARGELVYTVMNLYPYNSGHVMVCPYRHVADYTDLDL